MATRDADHPTPTPDRARVAVIASTYNRVVTDALRQGAAASFERARGASGDPSAWTLETIDAPGSFELPTLAAAALQTGRFDAVVVLGCVVKGETTHDHHIAASVAGELQRLATAEPARPIGFGLITADTQAQAEARAGGNKGNKGAEAMDAALATLAAIHTLRAGG